MKNSKILAFIGLVIIIIIGFYIFKFGGRPFSEKTADWGAFGDYLGGVLNPIIAGAGLILLLRTLSQNAEALKQNEKSLKQAKKMIKQGNKVIKQNAVELIETRGEVRQAREAQERLAEIERINLERKEIESNVLLYNKNIESIRKHIDELLKFNIYEDISSKENNSFSHFINTRSELILNSKESESPIKLLMKIMHLLSALGIEIFNEALLTKEPNKQVYVDIQKSNNEILYLQILQLISGAKVETTERVKGRVNILASENINDFNTELGKTYEKLMSKANDFGIDVTSQ